MDDITAASSVTALIHRYPTKVHAICDVCQHQGQASVFLDKGPPKLKCSACGNRDVRIAARDQLQSWSNKRRGR